MFLEERLGLEFGWLKNCSADRARSEMQRAALVCASGRAALEAMACGAATMICDWRGYQRPLYVSSYKDAMTHNYSGRGGVDPAHCDLSADAKARMKYGSRRAWVEKYHDAEKITDQLLECLQF